MQLREKILPPPEYGSRKISATTPPPLNPFGQNPGLPPQMDVGPYAYDDTHSLSVLVKELFKPRQQTISHTHNLTTILLLFYIEINPGPHIPKYPCGSCGRAVSNKQAAVSCDACDQWFHIKCQGMSQQTYNDNIGVDFSWTCSACTLSNIQVTLLNHTTSPTSTKSDPGSPLAHTPLAVIREPAKGGSAEYQQDKTIL